MRLIATVKRLGTRSLGSLLTVLFFLPMPALAYTISSWNGNFTSNNTGASLAEKGGTDPNDLIFAQSISHSGTVVTGSTTVTGTAGAFLSARLDLQGLTIPAGDSLTVSIQVGTHTPVTQTFNTGTVNPMGTFGPIRLDGGAEALKVSFTFTGATAFTYSSTTAQNLSFY